MTLVFGYASGLLWLLSSFAWAWSAFSKSPVRRNPHGRSSRGIEWFDAVPEDEAMSFNGLILPNADEFSAYQRKVAWRNTLAAGLSAAAAILACLAVAASTF